jgi:hypothetical protein
VTAHRGGEQSKTYRLSSGAASGLTADSVPQAQGLERVGKYTERR